MAQLKGRVKEQWGKLTDDEIDSSTASDQLVGKVQERYGIARDQAARDVDNWLNNTASVRLVTRIAVVSCLG